LLINKKSNDPSPQSYSNAKSNKILGGKIGTAKRGVDFTQVHSLFSCNITKGLM